MFCPKCQAPSLPIPEDEMTAYVEGSERCTKCGTVFHTYDDKVIESQNNIVTK